MPQPLAYTTLSIPSWLGPTTRMRRRYLARKIRAGVMASRLYDRGHVTPAQTDGLVGLCAVVSSLFRVWLEIKIRLARMLSS
jgi:hypothetical protein